MPADHAPLPDDAALSPVADCNCVSLRRASRRISLYYDACLAPVGLRATQFAMLAALARSEPLSVHGLAALLDMDRSTAGQNIKVLERDALIETIRSPQDGRARLIRLTAPGQARLEAATPLWRKAQADFEQLNTGSQAAAMRALLAGLKIPNMT